MTSDKNQGNQKGQTLIALLFFVLVGIIVTVASSLIIGINALAAAKLSQGEAARQLAETGAENAMISLLRDPTYSGETFAIGSDTIDVVVTGSTTKTIVSTGTTGNFVRKVEVVADYNGVLIPLSWKEIF